MANTDHFEAGEEDPWVTTGKARFAAAATPEEKMGILREYSSCEQEAQEAYENIMRRERGGYVGDGMSDDIIDIGELVDVAPTREAKLAVLRKYYTEEEAQREIHFDDMVPSLRALPTRQEKLALLREHFAEETVQARLRHIMGDEAYEASEETEFVRGLDAAGRARFAEYMARMSAARTWAEKRAVLRDYAPKGTPPASLGESKAGR